MKTDLNVQHTELKHLDANEELLINTKISKNYTNIVFSGGGIKGISHCGSLLELDEMGILYNNDKTMKITKICGVSAGAMIAVLFAINYSPIEISNIVKDLDFRKIMDDKYGCIRDFINFTGNWGICKGKFIQKMMKNLIAAKTGNGEYTFSDLFNDTGIELVIVATNLSIKKTCYFHHANDEYKNCAIYKAIRMSMGIPFIFEPFCLNDNYYVDGGLLDNYPLHIFDSELENQKQISYLPNPKTLGIKIMTEDDKKSDVTQVIKFTSLFDYSISYIETLLSNNEEKTINPYMYERSIINVTPNYKLTKFHVSDEEKENLLNIGKLAVKNFFGTN